MSLSYGLSLNSLVYFAISISCMLENDMVAVERVNQFSTLPSEAAWRKEDHLPPNWPTHGDIDISDLKVRRTKYLNMHSFILCCYIYIVSIPRKCDETTGLSYTGSSVECVEYFSLSLGIFSTN